MRGVRTYAEHATTMTAASPAATGERGMCISEHGRLRLRLHERKRG